MASKNESLFDAERLARTGSSNPTLIRNYNVEVREFVVLACLSELGEMDTGGIATRVGLSPTSVRYCIDALSNNGLVREASRAPETYLPTEDGRSLIRKSGESAPLQ